MRDPDFPIQGVRYPETWIEYRRSGDMSNLIEDVLTHPDGQDFAHGILWLAIGASDWQLINKLEQMGIRLPKNETINGSDSLLHGAMETYGDAPDIVRWLVVNYEAQLETRGTNYWTPLHRACRQGYLETVRALIELGADINASTIIDGGWTPLMEAAAGGHAKVVVCLLAAGADPSVVNNDGNVVACQIAKNAGHPEVALLLERGRRSPARTPPHAQKLS